MAHKHMNKILITGGAGFIGSHIAEALLNNGHRVVIVDNMRHGFKRNIDTRATFYKADICNYSAIDQIVKKERPVVINHHAAIAEVITSIRDPFGTYETNVQGTLNLLTAAAKYNVQRFVFASTGGTIYGEGGKAAVAEHHELLPESPYALSKLMGEQAVEYFSRTTTMSHCIFRYGNVFGPKQDPKGEAGVVAIFAELLASGKTATIFGDGSKTRDYVYIDDVVQANIKSMAMNKSITVNLGNGTHISDRTVYETVAQALGTKKQPRYKNIRPGEVMHIALNAQKAKRALGWKPRYTFTQGVTDYVTELYG